MVPFRFFSGRFIDPFLSGVIGVFLHVRCVPQQIRDDSSEQVCDTLQPYSNVWGDSTALGWRQGSRETNQNAAEDFTGSPNVCTSR